MQKSIEILKEKLTTTLKLPILDHFGDFTVCIDASLLRLEGFLSQNDISIAFDS